MGLINVLRYTFWATFLCVNTACVKTNNGICYKELRTQIDRNTPSLDVLIFDVKSEILVEKLKNSNLSDVFFIRENDTLDKIGYLKTKQEGINTTFFYRTTRFIGLNDTIQIKENIRNEKIILSFSDGIDIKLISCSNID